MKALVTGASSGIGLEIAKYLGSLGYDLVLVSRNILEIKEKFPTKVELISMDLTKEEDCYQLYEKYPDIDILVNNAGFGLFGMFSETDLDRELEMIDLNVKAVHILTKLYVQEFDKRDRGRILNVASIAGFMSGPLMSTYYATKNYVVSLSSAIKEELKRKKSKVSISILCPGPVKTNFDKVADVTFSLKGKESSYVAKCAVEGLLKKKFYIVPGISIKLLRIGSKIIPTSILTKFVYLSQKRKSN